MAAFRLPLLAFALWCSAAVLGATDPKPVFEAAPAWPAPYTPRLKPASDTAGVLRVLTVEERVGEPRSEELVRVPLFLHEDEPADPADWALYAEADTARRAPLVFQVDDVRRDDQGRLTRCHLYFTTTLNAWQRQRFVLVRRTGDQPSPATVPALTCRRAGDRVTLSGSDLAVDFLVAGPRAGAIAGLRPLGRTLDLADGWIAPELTLVRQTADCAVLRRTELSYRSADDLEVRDLRWGSGPLFAKLTVRVGPRGVDDSAEFTYRIPARGAVIIQSERLAPEGDITADVVGATDHRLLAGRLRLGNGKPETTQVPAGLRLLTRSTRGQNLDALVDRKAGLALLPVPYVQTGAGPVSVSLDGTVALGGPGSFRRNGDGNSGTLRAFWGEVRFAFAPATDPESLWHLARRQFQPLVAIVDEPDLGPADCRAAMPAIAQRFLEIKYWGRAWTQDAALLWLQRKQPAFEKLLERRPGAGEADPLAMLPKWAISDPPGPRDPKDQGRIDPYHLAYGSSTIPLYHLIAPSPRLPAHAKAIGLASRRAFGRVNQAGFPYIDSFATAFNMQLGPLGLGLFGGRGADDPALAGWALDALHAPAITGLYGHGQRAYAGEIDRPAASDFLYQNISDFHGRAIELATGEDLWLHPAALGRYFDAVDVTADLQHRPVAATGAFWSRANLFRGQAHDHRWEGWSCAPFTGMFAHRADRGMVGSTEAAYWLAEQGTRKQNWAELLWFTHAALLLGQLDKLPPPHPAPALPAHLRTRRESGANHLVWDAVPDVAGYRIYRAEKMGGPWTWLNSPYRETPGALVAETAFDDADGAAGSVYLVTAVDSAGRESRWYTDEPPRD